MHVSNSLYIPTLHILYIHGVNEANLHLGLKPNSSISYGPLRGIKNSLPTVFRLPIDFSVMQRMVNVIFRSKYSVVVLEIQRIFCWPHYLERYKKFHWVVFAKSNALKSWSRIHYRNNIALWFSISGQVLAPLIQISSIRQHISYSSDVYYE